MKLQHLTIMFIIIILPISIILSQYIDTQINNINLISTYDRRLQNSTYNAIKAFQINTVTNAFSDNSPQKRDDISAAVKTFYTSISNSMGFTGYKSSVVENYVPAVAFTLYDGYYIYAPYKNTLTSLMNEEDESSVIGKENGGISEEYADEITRNGLKPFVSYSCRYHIDESNDFVINYTLDNYITIYGKINNAPTYEKGYLMNGITVEPESEPQTDGTTKEREVCKIIIDKDAGKTIKISQKDDTECLSEYLGNKLYKYVKINGTKYYLEDDDYNNIHNIFLIDSDGNKVIQSTRDDPKNNSAYGLLKSAIENNQSAFQYFKDASEFTSEIKSKLGNLKPSDGIDSDGNKYTETYNIFDGDIQCEDSNFYRHKSEVIRNCIQKNLSIAIADYSSYTPGSDIEYRMPKISETDWNTIENNVCIITFMQGLVVGNRDYNSYSVVANDLTKEYIDEEDIYMLKNDNTYARVNENDLIGSLRSDLSYRSGLPKIDFEKRKYIMEDESTGDQVTVFNLPVKYMLPGDNAHTYAYLASYNSIIANTNIYSLASNEAISNNIVDMYKYMEKLYKDNHGSAEAIKLIKTYYMALGRERWCSYKETNNRTRVDNLYFDDFLGSYTQ